MISDHGVIVMIDPMQIVVTQAPDCLRTFLEVLQLTATCFLAIVAGLQAKAANSQAQTAPEHAKAAQTQAQAAQAQLYASLSPRLLPVTWVPINGGGNLSLFNQGQGTAYAIQWRFGRERNGADGEDALPNGSSTEIQLIHPNLDRDIIVTYHMRMVKNSRLA